MPTQSERDTKRAGAAGDGPAILADITRQTERIGSELDALGDAAREMVDSCRTLLRDGLSRQPYAVIATVAGVGYVLGGGLPRGVMRGLLLVGGRLLLNGAVARVASGFIERR